MEPRTGEAAAPPRTPHDSGRLASIDIARGIAILWVLGYHLWTDLRFPDVYPDQADAFREIPRQLSSGDVAGAIGALFEAVLRVGYLGVPLFMMLSGVSLTLTALLRESDSAGEARDLPRRLRRLMLPYWTGFFITIAFAAALALVQWQRHGGAPYLDFLRAGDISLHADQVVAGLLLVPRMFKNEWQFAPEGSLWFVVVVVQYYLLFPLLLAALRRSGPLPIVAASLAVTAASTALMVAATGDLLERRSWVETAAPFRIFELGVGIALGYALVRGYGSFLGTPASGFASIIVGTALLVAGCFVPLDGGYVAVLQWPLVISGLALMCAPLLMTSGDFAVPGRALAAIGLLSYALLIVNEPLRSITHTMRAEDAPPTWVAAWVVLGFVPLTFVLARPLAVILGLYPRRGTAAHSHEQSGQSIHAHGAGGSFARGGDSALTMCAHPALPPSKTDDTIACE